MSVLEDHIEFVNGMQSFQLSQVKKFAGQDKRVALHQNSANKCSDLIAFLESLKSQTANASSFVQKASQPAIRLNLIAEEIEGLPSELLEELSISESDKVEFRIVSLINEMGGVASLDRLLVAIYRKTGEVMKRTALNQRLYRMAQKEMIFSVPGKKGIYSTRIFSDEEASKLSGAVSVEHVAPNNLLLALGSPPYLTSLRESEN